MEQAKEGEFTDTENIGSVNLSDIGQFMMAVKIKMSGHFPAENQMLITTFFSCVNRCLNTK